MLKAAEVYALAEPEIVAAIEPAIAKLAERLGKPETVNVCPDGMEEWQGCLRVIQGIETWKCHAAWVTEKQPKFGPRVTTRFEWAKSVDPALEGPAREKRRRYRESLQRLLGDDALLVVPTGPCIAPLRVKALTMLSIAGVTGAAQINIPVALYQGCPVGLSLIAPPGADRALLAFVKSAGF
jgi:amidase